MSRYPGGLASPTLHDPFPEVKSNAPELSLQRIGVIGQVILDLILAQIALALGNITVLGQKPFAFLTQWGQDLQQRAIDAFNNAGVAQSSANYANAQLSILTGGALASNVTGGVSLAAQFTGAAANNLGADFSRTSDGPGAGNFGPNGSGQAVWRKSGGLWRRHIDRHTTSLATDYQALFTVVSKIADAPSFGSDAYIYLLARMNSAADTFVYCRIGRGNLEVGKRNSGTWTAWTSVDITANAGDQFAFIVGTTADDREVVVRQNGVARITYTDGSSSAMGASYRYVGLASQAAERNFLTDQTRPAELDVWSAADRLPSTV